MVATIVLVVTSSLVAVVASIVTAQRARLRGRPPGAGSCGGWVSEDDAAYRHRGAGHGGAYRRHHHGGHHGGHHHGGYGGHGGGGHGGGAGHAGGGHGGGH